MVGGLVIVLIVKLTNKIECFIIPINWRGIVLERNRILKQETIMDNYRIAGMYSLNEEDRYQKEVLDIINKLFDENPNCFDKDVIDYKINLSNKLVKKYNLDMNKYYHYTFKDRKHTIGIRYRNLTDDIIMLLSGYLRDKVILQIVKYETNNECFSELKSLVVYDKQTSKVKIVNISFSETMNDKKDIYYWSNDNQSEGKTLVKAFNN